MTDTIITQGVPEQDSADWHRIRSEGIGGSEIGVIIGVNRWQTAFDLWAVKTGRKPPFEGNAATHWGHLLEDIVAQEYGRRTGATIMPSLALKHGHCRGYTDRMAQMPDGEVRLVEIKTSGAGAKAEWGEEGTDQIPPSYLAQVQFYLAMLPSEIRRADVAVLIGGQDFRLYAVERDDAQGKALMDAAERFWTDHIVADVPPPHDETTDTIATMHPSDDGSLLTATADVEAMLDAYAEAKAEADAAVERADKAKAALCAVIGDASGIEGVCGCKATWKAQARKTTDWQGLAKDHGVSKAEIEAHTKMTTSRVFRFTPRKIEEETNG